TGTIEVSPLPCGREELPEQTARPPPARRFTVRRLAFGLALVLIVASVRADDKPQPVELFNGRDLAGWVDVNCAPDTWQARQGLIICSGKPKGVLRSERMYENYVLELEWKHLHPKGNAGLMVHADALPRVGAPYPRSVEVQIMDGDHGSVFGI